MTGQEHYSEAERLLALAAVGGTDPRDPLIVATAQVHATLALAAATGNPLGFLTPEQEAEITNDISDPWGSSS